MTTTPFAEESQLPKVLQALAKPSKAKAGAAKGSSALELVLLPYESKVTKAADPRPSARAIINPRSYWVQLAKAFEKKIYVDAMKFLEGAPVDVIVEQLKVFPATTASWMAMSTIIARCGIDALDFFVRYAAEDNNRIESIRFFELFDSPAIARAVVEARGKLKSAKADCDRWLLAHPKAAAIGIIPIYVGKSTAKQKRDAEAALRFVAEKKQPLLLEVAQRYSDEVAAIIAKMLGSEVVEPPKKASLQGFVDLETLPVVFLRGRTHRLPLSAHERILFVIQQKQQQHPVTEIKAACDPKSLAEFVTTIFERWVDAKLPTTGGWALTALGLLGDDSSALRLAPLVRRWPGESRSKRAVDGIYALAEINTDLAWTLIQDIADQTPYSSIRFSATLKLKELANARGLHGDIDRLSDRIVPRDPDQLKAVEQIQVRRFERIMCMERPISAQDFLEYFVRHPLLGHLVRTVVWMTRDGETFRVVEDLTFANESDDTWQLPTDANTVVTIGHPANLDEDLVERWQKVFADYKIIQPFSQLDRVVYRPESLDANEITVANGRTIATGRLYSLRRRGWRIDDPRDVYNPDRGDPDDESGPPRIESLSKPLQGGSAILEINPGFYLGTGDLADPTQTITRVRLTTTVGKIGNVTYSELVTDLESLA